MNTNTFTDTFEGYYLTLEILDNNNLKITPTAHIIEFISDKNYNDQWWELIEDIPEFSLVRPEYVGALTDSPIIALNAYLDDNEYLQFESLWWLPEYQVFDELKALFDGESIIFRYVEFD